MKNTTLLALLLAFSLCLPTSAQETSVLFVGNSHTFYNDMPELFEGLATAGFHSVYVSESTYGGSTLSFHSHYDPTLEKIAEREWDRVVLQEHSLFPAIEYWRDNSFYPSARTLDSLITDTGSQTAFYITQGWEDASGPYCIEDYCSPKFDGYFDMQQDVTAAYRNIGNELDALIVPCGEAWAAALSVDPELPLWAFDGYHPSLEGSYLTACTFYAHIFGESPYGVEFFGGLDLQTALFYQQIAWLVTSSQAQAPEVAVNLQPAYPNPFNPARPFASSSGRWRECSWTSSTTAAAACGSCTRVRSSPGANTTLIGTGRTIRGARCPRGSIWPSLRRGAAKA